MKMGRWEAPYELLLKSYEDGMAYYGELKKKGELQDLTMSQFADYYRAHKTYTQPECALWKDILYGSEKQLFWYVDPYMRFCLDMNQGGAMVDLRPYVSKINRPVGIGTGHVQDASYPFLIQEKYRAGYFTHYAGEGTIKSCKISFRGEEADLCLCRTKARFSEQGSLRILTLDPVEIEFAQLKLTLQSSFYLEEGSSCIHVKRELLSVSDPDQTVEMTEYFTGCYGTTEYPEPMEGILLECGGEQEKKRIEYAYRCREEETNEGGDVYASVTIPQISTRAVLSAQGEAAAFIREGYAFSPMYTLGIRKSLKEKEAMETWLRLEKAD